MLRRRRIASTLFLGVATDAPDGLAAHAWVSVGDEILTGAAGSERFTPLSAFGISGPSRSASEAWTRQRSAGQALKLHAELIRVTDALADADIPVVAFKGVTLALRVYGNVAGRSFGDNDILVRHRDAQRAYEVVESLGYTPYPHQRLDLALRRTNEIRMSVDGTDLEPHWSLFKPTLFPVSEEFIWSRTEPFECGGLRCLVLDPYMTIVHLANHYAMHRFEWEKCLRDVAAAWNTWHERIDAGELVDVARKAGQLPALAIALRRTADRELLDAPPPLIRSRHADLVLRLLHGRLGSISQGRLICALALARPDRALRVLGQFAFPPAYEFPLIYPDGPGRIRRFTRPIELGLGVAVGTVVSRTRATSRKA